MKKCPKCNIFLEDDDTFCIFCGQKVYKPTPTYNTDEIEVIHLNEENQKCVKCPSCGSTQIQIIKRGWTLTTGLIGSNKVQRVCVNCKHKF